MPLIDVCKAVALAVGQRIPASIVGATDRSSMELYQLANEIGQRICWDAGIDWDRLTTVASFNPATATHFTNYSSFPMPADFKRMPRYSSVFRTSSPRRPLLHCTDIMRWESDEYSGLNSTFQGMWMIRGDTILVKPSMSASPTDRLIFPYLSNRINQSWTLGVPGPTPGVQGPTWISDAYYFPLDERLLKLGMVWQWRANHGSPYAEDMATFESALSNARVDNKGTQEIIFEAVNYLSRYQTAQSYPYPTPSVSPYPL